MTNNGELKPTSRLPWQRNDKGEIRRPGVPGRIADPVKRLDALEKYDERAGIVEFDGKQTREAAEALALAELKSKVEPQGRLL